MTVRDMWVRLAEVYDLGHRRVLDNALKGPRPDYDGPPSTVTPINRTRPQAEPTPLPRRSTDGVSDFPVYEPEVQRFFMDQDSQDALDRGGWDPDETYPGVWHHQDEQGQTHTVVHTPGYREQGKLLPWSVQTEEEEPSRHRSFKGALGEANRRMMRLGSAFPDWTDYA